MLLGIASILIGTVMLKGVLFNGLSYLVIISGTLTLLGAIAFLFQPLTILVLFGLTLGAVSQLMAGVKLFRLDGKQMIIEIATVIEGVLIMIGVVVAGGVIYAGL